MWNNNCFPLLHTVLQSFASENKWHRTHLGSGGRIFITVYNLPTVLLPQSSSTFQTLLNGVSEHEWEYNSPVCSFGPSLLQVQRLQTRGSWSNPRSSLRQRKQTGSRQSLVLYTYKHSPRPSAGRIIYLSSLTVGVRRKTTKRRETLDKRWLKIAVTQSSELLRILKAEN